MAEEAIVVTGEELRRHVDSYSEAGLFGKFAKDLLKLGAKLIYQALLLFYVTKSPDCPTGIKLTLYGALGYLISPIDLIPDVIPVLGYTDDAVAIATALGIARLYITDEIKAQARGKIYEWFGEEGLKQI